MKTDVSNTFDTFVEGQLKNSATSLAFVPPRFVQPQGSTGTVKGTSRIGIVLHLLSQLFG
jgi:hypothetical protein